MNNKQIASVWGATNAVSLSAVQEQSLVYLLNRTFRNGVEHRMKGKALDSSTDCVRCGTLDPLDPLTCELDAFNSYGLHCVFCRDENWNILRRDNELNND